MNIRTGIVLDKHEGALARMITPYKFFIGGPLGSGKQWFPWIHIEDVIGIFLFTLKKENNAGVLNAVSPNPVRMKIFSKSLGKVMKRPSLINVPKFILRIIFGEAADTILYGAKVIPKRTEENEYKFIYPELEPALKNLLK